MLFLSPDWRSVLLLGEGELTFVGTRPPLGTQYVSRSELHQLCHVVGALHDQIQTWVSFVMDKLVNCDIHRASDDVP